jgi:hypothetical protein
MGGKKNAYSLFVGKAEQNRPFGKTGVDWRTILTRILQKQSRIAWTAFIGLRTETSSGNFETQ